MTGLENLPRVRKVERWEYDDVLGLEEAVCWVINTSNNRFNTNDDYEHDDR